MRHHKRSARPSPRAYASGAPNSYNNGQYSGSWSASRGGNQLSANQKSSWSEQASQDSQHGSNSAQSGGKYRSGQQSSSNQYGSAHGADNGQYQSDQHGPAQAANNGQYSQGQRQGNQGSTWSQQDQPQAISNGQYQQSQSQGNQASTSNQQSSAQGINNGQHDQGQSQRNQGSSWNQDNPAKVADDGQYHPAQPKNKPAIPPNDPKPHNPPPKDTDNNPDDIPVTNTIPNTATLATSDPTLNLQTSLAPTETQPTSTASLAAGSEGSSGMKQGAQAGVAISVIAAIALIAGLILIPLRKRQKRLQRELHQNPGWKIRSDPEKTSGVADPLQRFASGLYMTTATTMCAASAFIKPKAALATDVLKSKAGAIYACRTSGARPQRLSSSDASPHEDYTEARDVESGNGGGQGTAPVSPDLRMTISAMPKFPLLSAKSSKSDLKNPPTQPVSPIESGHNVNLSPNPGLPPPPSRTVSSCSTAWETQADAQSLYSPRSPLGSLENASTGNLLALNPSINETYLVERGFTPSSQGQLELRPGQMVGISQIFENGWVCYTP